MKRLFALFISSPRTKPVFAEEESLARAMQIAEWLLSEIAVPPAAAAS